MAINICYSCISRGDVILVDKELGHGNYQFHVRSILAQISININKKTTLPHDDMLYHTITDNGLVYVCAADKETGRRLPYQFLEKVKQEFSNAGALMQRSSGAGAFEFNRDFRNSLGNLMADFNSGKGDQLTAMQNQVGEVTGIMRQNVEKVLDRGDKLDDLVDKTEELQAGASTFKVNATRIQRKMFWQNRKMTIIIVVVVLVVIIAIVLIILASQGVI